MTFALDPRLAADTLAVGDFALCRVLLMNDSRYPWLILVPRRAGLSEIHDLAARGARRLDRGGGAGRRRTEKPHRREKNQYRRAGQYRGAIACPCRRAFCRRRRLARPGMGVGRSVPYRTEAAKHLVRALASALGAGSAEFMAVLDDWLCRQPARPPVADPRRRGGSLAELAADAAEPARWFSSSPCRSCGRARALSPCIRWRRRAISARREVEVLLGRDEPGAGFRLAAAR